VVQHVLALVVLETLEKQQRRDEATDATIGFPCREDRAVRAVVEDHHLEEA
jgi:hypothetical protein